MHGRFVSRRVVFAAMAAGALAASTIEFAADPATAQGPPVKIGELNSYSRMAAFAGPYRNGMQLAMDEINAKGGLLGGRKLEIVFRDDGATPGDAVRVAEELLTRENVSFLAGTFLSNVGLAVADFANQRKTLFLATEPLTDAITMGSGNKYTYRVRPSTFMQTKMLVDAIKGKGVKKWAIVAPNYQDRHARRRNRRRAVPGSRQDRRRCHRRRARADQA
jgi:branched-chain amino acid transport system substrate-binding protein